MLHLKRIHFFNDNSDTYRCIEGTCFQSFRDANSFKRHLMRKHSIPLVSSNKPEKRTEIDQPQEVLQVNQEASSSSTLSLSEQPKQLIKDDTASDLLKNVFISAAKFSLYLHDNNFSRKDVIDVQENVNELILNPIMLVFKQFAENNLQDHKKVFNELTSLIMHCRDTFKLCKTEYLMNQWLKKEGLMRDVTKFSISSEVKPVHKSETLTYQEIDVQAVIMPLKFQFQAVLEQNNYLEKTLSYMSFLKNDLKFTNFIQGELWRQKSNLYPNEIIIPYFIYLDDVEINNPLGSHATTHSTCNLYYSFPCIPKQESRLQNIFLGAILKTADFKLHGSNNCLSLLIEHLRELEVTGINIKSSKGNSHKAHFVLALVLGDNLGLNTILNFNKSFSANSFCRFCRAVKTETQNMCIEQEDKMRSKENYAEDIEIRDPSKTGITAESSLNEIPSFHVVDNYCVDVTHDVFEGICHYDFTHIIMYFIDKMKYFDLETLNMRKQFFNYGPADVGNISGEIKVKHLSNKHLKMSASEMMTFSNYFTLMIGDLVPDDDEVWQFLVNLIEIIDIVLCFEMTADLINLLKCKIGRHHRDYIRLFNDTLKPKHHNLIHYPTVVKMSGPLRKYWCFKYETKHRQFKMYSRSITSRRNICLSLAKNFQLKFASFLLRQEDFSDFIFDEKHEILKCGYNQIIVTKLMCQPNDIKTFTKVNYRGISYEKGFYVANYNGEDVAIYSILSNVIS